MAESGKTKAGEWVESNEKITLTPFQHRAMQLLADAFGTGIYNLPITWRRVEWRRDWVLININLDLATYDFAEMTRLVFAAHDACIRVQITAWAPRYIKLSLHRRVRDGDMMQRHPTIEDALAMWRSAGHQQMEPVDG